MNLARGLVNNAGSAPEQRVKLDALRHVEEALKRRADCRHCSLEGSAADSRDLLNAKEKSVDPTRALLFCLELLFGTPGD